MLLSNKIAFSHPSASSFAIHFPEKKNCKHIKRQNIYAQTGNDHMNKPQDLLDNIQSLLFKTESHFQL